MKVFSGDELRRAARPASLLEGERRNTDGLRALIKEHPRSASWVDPTSTKTPLFEAVAHRSAANIKVLLEGGAGANHRDKEKFIRNMAFSAHKSAEDVKEFTDDALELERKVDILVALIRKSKHLVAFTGAGVSTSAGIPDFRGPDGVWTLRAAGKEREKPTVSTLKAVPTTTHMSLVALERAGILKYLISQNCDGLHRRSGMSPSKLSELHGNSNLERCASCQREYLRDFRAVASYRDTVHDHRTGRMCVACGGELHDTIINFQENLPSVPLNRAYENSRKSDLHVVLGSSLTVSPANDLPEETVRQGGKLVIVNLQRTPLDKLAYLRIFAKTDEVMKMVVAKLAVPILPFVLTRHLCVKQEPSYDGRLISLFGISSDNLPVTFIKSLTVQGNPVEGDVFKIAIAGMDAGKVGQLALRLEFFGHYNEPLLSFPVPLSNSLPSTSYYDLLYNPLTGQWCTQTRQHAPTA